MNLKFFGVFKRHPRATLTSLFVGPLIASAVYIVYFRQTATTEAEPSEFAEAASLYESQNAALALPRITEHNLKKGSTFAQALRDAGFDNAEIHDLVRAAKGVKDLNHVPSKLSFTIHWVDQPKTQATQVDLSFSESQSLKLTRTGPEDWNAEWIDLPIEKSAESFSGVVKNSLWDSATTAGMDPQLVVQLSTVFAWQVDFNREVQPEDRWRIVVEKLFVHGKHIGWGHILAAEYENHGELHTAIRFPQEGPNASYYTPDGASLKRMFLKSPLEFGRISSRFKSNRFHPILKKSMPHNGVDYAAAVGTPIMSVGKGIVEFAGPNGGSGTMVKIRHNSVYTTAYLHMSRIAKTIRKGAKVEQGQLIGYVGATGLATGPHLHFAFYENGTFVDPLGRKFPAADPVSEQEMENFSMLVTKVLKFLPAWSVAEQLVKDNTDT